MELEQIMWFSIQVFLETHYTALVKLSSKMVLMAIELVGHCVSHQLQCLVINVNYAILMFAGPSNLGLDGHLCHLSGGSYYNLNQCKGGLGI